MLRSEEPWAIARMLTPGLAERAEKLGRDAGRMDHVVADRRQDAAARTELDLLDLPVVELGEKRLLDGLFGEFVPCASGTAKQIECSELACEIMITETFTSLQRAEEPVGDAGNADHAGAFEVDQCDLVDCREAFDGALGCSRGRGIGAMDFGARVSGIESVADPDRDPRHQRRGHGMRDARPWRRSKPAPWPRS